MKITSDKSKVIAPIERVYQFLLIPANYEKLLPVEKISEFRSDENHCLFKIQGGITISLLKDGSEEFSVIRMKSGEKAPFAYNLSIRLEEVESETIGFIEFEANVNMFMKMLIEGQLLSLFNSMTQKLKEQF